MTDIEAIFRGRKMSRTLLNQYGFAEDGNSGGFFYTAPLMGGEYAIHVAVTVAGEVSYSVTEEDGEEYTLVKIPSAQGPFVGEMRGECEAVLCDIARRAFEKDTFAAGQAKRIISYIREKYGAEPEFLWESAPSGAVFRHADNRKWFAIIMSVDKSRVVADSHGQVDIIGLKDSADTVAGLIDGVRFHRAYHMNKKYWYEIILDGGVDDEIIEERINASFTATQGKK